jgi:hypothetical protein
MNDTLHTLDDATAVRVLEVLARRELDRGAVMAEATPHLRAALAAAFGDPAPGPPVTIAELAHGALAIAATDPATGELDPNANAAIAALAAGPASRAFFDPATSLPILVAALVILQTHVRFERDKDGRWSLKVEKKPTAEALLKPLVQKLLAFWG